MMMQRKRKGEAVATTSADFLAEQLARLKELFPEAFTEGKVDWDKLRATMGDFVDDGSERYTFTWAGKRDAIRLLQTPTRATLIPCREESVNFDGTQHLFIEGDNLEVLKLLYKPYFGRVKMIYIDPPYNTGQDFIYPDNYADPLATYLQLTGQQDAEGNLLTSNPETSGRYHSAWLSMMYPRLFLARQLLREDGVIFVSIDDHEVHNLRLLMNEVFGEENFLATAIWQKMYSGKADASHFGRFHEYLLCYAKNADTAEIYLLPRTQEMNARYSNPDNDSRGPWLSNDLTASGERSEGHYDVISPTGKVFDAPQGKHWLYARSTMLRLVKDNRVWFGKDGSAFPRLKRFLSGVQPGRRVNTLWLHKEVGHTDEATKEIKSIFTEEQRLLETPKPTRLMRRLLQIATRRDFEDVVLDFFAGSGTLAQAILELNREDGGNRRFIMAQLPEPTPEDSPARQAGYEAIADIGKERIRRVIAQMQKEREGQLPLETRETPEDLGFKVFKLAPSNYQLWRGVGEDTLDAYAEQMALFADPLVDGWTAENVIYEVALKEGYGLNCRIEPISPPLTSGVGARATIYRVTDVDKEQSFTICLDNAIGLEDLSALNLDKDDLFICRDVALDDEAAANLALQCRLKTI
jgi:adenine-specific DNA-methyltransferase